MKYKDFYTDILIENVQTGISSDTNEVELIEPAFVYLKEQVEKLNKKANRWKVPPLTLNIIKEWPVKVLKYLTLNNDGYNYEIVDINRNIAPNDRLVNTSVMKMYKVSIDGKPPIVEGYQFIAKVEHTEAGNIINYAPDISEKNVPAEYRNVSQACDVCKQNRERFNTYILRLTKDDIERFPGKKTGDYIMAGSACLKRFLPGVSVASLVQYAELLNQLSSAMKGGEEGLDMEKIMSRSQGGHYNYESVKHLLTWLSAAYLHTGKYISNSRSKESYGSIESTSQTAYAAMNYTPTLQHRDELYYKMQDETFEKKSAEMAEEVIKWAKNQNFIEKSKQNPQYDSLYKNLDVISKLDYVKNSNYNYVSALFGMYLHDSKKTNPNAAPATPIQNDYLGTIGQKVTLNVEVKNVKEFQNSFGYYGGTSYIISMYGEEKGTGKKGNITYFSSNPILNKDDKAEIVATVKNHQVNKYTNKPETLITRAKVVKS